MRYIKTPIVRRPEVFGCSTFLDDADGHIALIVPVLEDDTEHALKATEIVRAINAYDDLLAACKAFVRWATADDEENVDELIQVVKQARAAIAKAEEGQ